MINREERYKAANEAQKHYDNMSSLIIGSIIATPAAVLIAYKDLKGTNHSEYLLFGAAIVILILWSL